MAVASLVPGIISIVLAMIGFQWAGAICGIVGIICGASGKKLHEKRDLAQADTSAPSWAPSSACCSSSPAWLARS